jgi:hypothetical protein
MVLANPTFLSISALFLSIFHCNVQAVRTAFLGHPDADRYTTPTHPFYRFGQDRIYIHNVRTVYLVISKPKIPCVHRICIVLANPTFLSMSALLLSIFHCNVQAVRAAFLGHPDADRCSPPTHPFLSTLSFIPVIVPLQCTGCPRSIPWTP